MIDIATLEALVASGVSAEQLLIAVKGMASASERKRKYDRQRVAKLRQEERIIGQPELKLVQQNQMESSESFGVVRHETTPNDSPDFKKGPHTPIKTTSDDDDHEVAAPAAKSASAISQTAWDLVADVGKLAGFATIPDQPPGWAGFAYFVQNFLNSGYSADAIRLGCSTALKRKRDGPPERHTYFEKPIAQAKALLDRPTPQVVQLRPQNVEVIHAKFRKPPSLYELAARRVHDLQAEIDADQRGDCHPHVELAAASE